MSYTPYFRYRTSSLNLGGITAPVFPAATGARLHTYPLEKPEYTETGRRHGTTSVSWRTKSIQKTARDTVKAFWHTTLLRGYNDITVIDNAGRMLFDASWADWRETWRKSNGGLYDIQYDLLAPVPWTSPVFGAYLSTTKEGTNHNLSGDDLTLDDGEMTDVDTDANVLRKNGFALKMSCTAGGDTGATATGLTWRARTGSNSLTLFCQMRVPSTDGANGIAVLLLARGTITVAIDLRPDTVTTNVLMGHITDGSGYSFIQKSDASYPVLDADTWYDVALTYDAVNSKVYMYWCASELSSASYTDFLDGATSEESGIISTLTSEIYPQNVTWTAFSVLREYDVGGIVAGDAYAQNIFVLDGFITPLDFNTMRRQCWMWNFKTSGTWPA